MANLVYTNAKVQFTKGTLFPLTDTWKVILMSSSYTPNQDTDTYYSDIIANEITGTGYTAGGITLSSPSVTADATNHRSLYDATNVTWASLTASNVRYAVIYKSTGVSSTSPLIALVDFGTNQTISGANFTLPWSTSPAAIFYLA